MWSSLISTIRVFKFVSVFVIINPQRNKYIKDTNSSTELGCCCTSNIVTSTKRIIAINDMNCIDCDDNTICFDCYDNRNKDDSIVVIVINRIDCNNDINCIDYNDNKISSVHNYDSVVGIIINNINYNDNKIFIIDVLDCVGNVCNVTCIDCYDNRIGSADTIIVQITFTVRNNNKDAIVDCNDINRIDCSGNKIGSVDTIIVPITCNGSSSSSSRVLPSSLSINTSKEIGGDRIDCNNTGGTSIGKGGVYGSKHLSLSPLSLPLFGYCFTFRINNNASSSASSFIHHVSCNPHTDDVLLGSVPKSLVLQSQDL